METYRKASKVGKEKFFRVHEGEHSTIALSYITSSLISGETGWQMACSQVAFFFTTLSLFFLFCLPPFFWSMRIENKFEVE